MTERTDQSGAMHAAGLAYLLEMGFGMSKDVPDIAGFIEALPKWQSEDDRMAAARALADKLIPDEPNFEMWQRWLNGGTMPSDLEVPKFRRGPSYGAQQSSMARPMGRLAGRAATMLDAARQAEQEAARLLKEAESIRKEVREMSLFARAFLVNNLALKFLRLNEPRLAVGPAWVVLDAIHDSAARDMIHARLRSLSGDTAFKFRLAQAVALVCDEFADAAAAVDTERKVAGASTESMHASLGEDDHLIQLIRSKLGLRSADASAPDDLDSASDDSASSGLASTGSLSDELPLEVSEHADAINGMLPGDEQIVMDPGQSFSDLSEEAKAILRPRRLTQADFETKSDFEQYVRKLNRLGVELLIEEWECADPYRAAEKRAMLDYDPSSE